jgi:hypothetical protein
VVLADQTDAEGSPWDFDHVDRLGSSRDEIRSVLDLLILIMQYSVRSLLHDINEH